MMQTLLFVPRVLMSVIDQSLHLLVETAGILRIFGKILQRAISALVSVDFPTFFFPLGPHFPSGHGSILPLTELCSKYFCKMISKLQRESIKSFEPKEQAVRDFKIHRETFLQRTAWSQPCRSWFKNGTTDGPIMMYPGSRLHFIEMLREPRYEDYDYVLETNNRFSYMGNGLALREFDGSDLSHYMGFLKDEGDRLPTSI